MRYTALASLLLLSTAACSFSGPDDNADETGSDSPTSSNILATDEMEFENDSMSFSDVAAQQNMSAQPSNGDNSSNQPADDFDAPEHMQLQVVLDAMGFSPGIIDGKMGMSTRNAISAFQEQSGLEVTGQMNEKTTAKLNTQMSVDATRVVTIPPEYGNLTFDKIPKSGKEKAAMERLGYESMWEKLAERFHTTKEVLQSLNPEIKMADASPKNEKTKPDTDKSKKDTSAQVGAQVGAQDGSQILAVGSKLRVPNIGADKIIKGSVEDRDWLSTLVSLGVGSKQPQATKIVVDKSDGTLKAFDVSGKLVGAYTATMGSEHDPLPLGNWDILAKAYNPPFSLDPTLMWDMPNDAEKLSLPPGPNGPVGVVWIDLSKEHYGIHGTPDPETIGRAQSHGCVRLTNWDVARLAQMVSTDTKVIFQA